MYLHHASWHSLATLTEVFPCFFLHCKANARVKPAKMGHGPHSSKIFVLFLFLCCYMYEGDSISKLQIVIEKNRMEIMTYKQHLFFNIISIQI